MFGVPVELIKKGNPEYALRQKGKVAELALGYQGSTGALLQMGALNMGLTEAELPEIVGRWRRANPRITDLWQQLESAAFQAVREGVAGAAKGIVFRLESAGALTFLTVRLPSGRKLYYCNPIIHGNEKGRDALYYYGADQKTGKWALDTTYGGKLTENIVQAIARDCLAESQLALTENGYRIVMHIHDENVAEIPEAGAADALRRMCGIMSAPMPWAPDLPLKAEGFVSDYYKKD
jgi:DNA polymerase